MSSIIAGLVLLRKSGILIPTFRLLEYHTTIRTLLYTSVTGFDVDGSFVNKPTAILKSRSRLPVNKLNPFRLHLICYCLSTPTRNKKQTAIANSTFPTLPTHPDCPSRDQTRNQRLGRRRLSKVDQEDPTRGKQGSIL